MIFLSTTEHLDGHGPRPWRRDPPPRQPEDQGRGKTVNTNNAVFRVEDTKPQKVSLEESPSKPVLLHRRCLKKELGGPPFQEPGVESAIDSENPAAHYGSSPFWVGLEFHQCHAVPRNRTVLTKERFVARPGTRCPFRQSDRLPGLLPLASPGSRSLKSTFPAAVRWFLLRSLPIGRGTKPTSNASGCRVRGRYDWVNWCVCVCVQIL